MTEWMIQTSRVGFDWELLVFRHNECVYDMLFIFPDQAKLYKRVHKAAQDAMASQEDVIEAIERVEGSRLYSESESSEDGE